MHQLVEPTEFQEVSGRPRLKVLLSAFACQPDRGSEGGTGWNAVEYLHRHHDLTVMVAAICRSSVESHLQSRPLPNVQWEFVDLPWWLIGRERLKRAPLRVYYYLWQLWALRAARKLARRTRFDVTHHITFGCYWRPSFLALLDVPFVWGPVGGAQSVPRQFRATLPLQDRLFAIAKVAAEWTATVFDPLVRLTARRATIAIPTSQKGLTRMKRLGTEHCRLLPQISLPGAEIEQLGALPVRQEAGPFRLISLGRLVGWKGIHLGLQAFAEFHKHYPDSEYWHVGDGPMRHYLQKMANRLGAAGSFKIIPNATRQEALALLGRSDVLLFPCLYDEPGWVVLEAMAARRPVLFVYGKPHVPGADEAGFTPRRDTPANTIADLALALLTLASDLDLRLRMGEAGHRLVRTHYHMRDWFRAMDDILREAAAMKVDPRTL